MPWTFAHPAVVLPLRRMGSLRLPLSGLVVGSLVPDFGYYVGRFELATCAHSAIGAVFICVPVAFLLILFLRKFRLFLIAPIPGPHRAALERLTTAPLLSLANMAIMIAAILIGAATHIAWDSFTHASGALVSAFSILREELFVLAGRSFAVYNVLQHVSTMLGLTVMSVAYLRWLQRSMRAEQDARWGELREYMPLVIALALSVALGLASALLKSGPESSYSIVIVRGVIHSTIAFLAAYALLALRASK